MKIYSAPHKEDGLPLTLKESAAIRDTRSDRSLNQLPAGASESAMVKTLAQRLLVFSAELSISRERLARWSFCHAVLSAFWDWEESAEWRHTMKLARSLAKLS